MTERKSLLEAAQRQSRELTEAELKQIAGASESNQSISDGTYDWRYTYSTPSPRLDYDRVD